MKNKIFSVFAIMLCAVVAFSFAACSDAEGNGDTQAPTETDIFEPATDRGKESELYKRYAEYRENATLAFKSNETAYAEDFEYAQDGEGVKITKYVGNDNIIVMPEKIDGLAVTHVAEGAFEGKNIRALYIPDGIYVESGALAGCDALVTLRLPTLSENDYLGRIFGAAVPDENAVTVPPSLDMLILGEGTVEISADAFLGCKTISAVILPDSVKIIGDAVFYECADLVYVSLGDGIEKIGEYAFAYCRTLYGIDISMADEIGDGVLFSCTALNNIKIKTAENEFLGRIFGADKPEYNADFVPESLRCVEIAEGSKIIPDRMFSSCKYITDVILPESLEEIGIRAFYACRSLGSIKMTSVKKVSDDAFFGCDNLIEVDLGDSLGALGMQAFFGCGALKSVSLPSTLTELKSSTFCGCSSLVTVELGGVKKIGKDAFSGCVKLAPVSTEGIEVAEGNGALLTNMEE